MSAKLTKSLYEQCCDPLTAIAYVLEACPSGDVRAFLADWQDGDFWGEYEQFAGRAALEKNP